MGDPNSNEGTDTVVPWVYVYMYFAPVTIEGQMSNLVFKVQHWQHRLPGRQAFNVLTESTPHIPGPGGGAAHTPFHMYFPMHLNLEGSRFKVAVP